MPKRPKIVVERNATGPHPYAFLSGWREKSQMSQQKVADYFGVSDVTVHRWETGKTPVAMPTWFELAKLYGAQHPGELWFPPADAHLAVALRDAFRIIAELPAEAREQWLGTGRAMRDLARKPPADAAE